MIILVNLKIRHEKTIIKIIDASAIPHHAPTAYYPIDNTNKLKIMRTLDTLALNIPSTHACHSARKMLTFCMVFLALFIVFSTFASTDCFAKSKKKSSSNANNRYAGLVMDAETGAILYQSNPDKVLYPASLTKMMTLLMTFDALENGRLSLNQRIRISNHAASMSPSKLGLKPGSSIRVEDAILALVTKSANDIAAALAEAIGGSESRFGQMMTQRARGIGMTRSRFYNASGLPNPGQVSTARDMAILARYIITHYPRYYRYFGTRSFTYGGVKHRNHNRLMETYQGMDGFKTGYINASGFNLVASAKRGNVRLIGVVFGGRTTVSRNNHMAELLDNGFAQMKDRVLMAQQNKTAPATPQTNTQINTLAAPPQPAMTAYSPAAVEPAMAMNDTPSFSPVSYSHVDIYPPPLPERKRTAIPAASHPPATPTQQHPLNPAVLTQSTDRALASMATTTNTLTSADRLAAPMPPSNGQATILGTLGPNINASAAAPVATTHTPNTWSIQIGAYQSRAVTDQALYQASQQLPAHLKNAQAVIVPLRTADAQWMFRARLAGFSQNQAQEACRYFKNCMTISPETAAQ